MREFFSHLMAEQKALVRRAPGFVVMYILITTTAFALLDIYAYEAHGLYGLVSFLSWGLGYILFLGLMQQGGLTPEGTRTGVGTYFALGIAVSIPVSLALVVLIIPGLYLLMRWLPAYSRALVSTDGVGNSMRWSWAQTEAWQRPLSLCMLFPILWFGASIAVPAIYFNYVEYVGDEEFALWSIFINAGVSIGFAWLTVYSVAAFKLICERTVESGVSAHGAAGTGG